MSLGEGDHLEERWNSTHVHLGHSSSSMPQRLLVPVATWMQCTSLSKTKVQPDQIQVIAEPENTEQFGGFCFVVASYRAMGNWNDMLIIILSSVELFPPPRYVDLFCCLNVCIPLKSLCWNEILGWWYREMGPFGSDWVTMALLLWLYQCRLIKGIEGCAFHLFCPVKIHRWGHMRNRPWL
jgi:hypothetical protein